MTLNIKQELLASAKAQCIAPTISVIVAALGISSRTEGFGVARFGREYPFPGLRPFVSRVYRFDGFKQSQLFEMFVHISPFAYIT